MSEDNTLDQRKLDEHEDLLIRIEGHRLIANDWGTGNLIMLAINIILSAIASSALFSLLGFENADSASEFSIPILLGEIMTLLVTINSGLLAGLNPAKRVNEHREAIAGYNEAKRLPLQSEERSEMIDAVSAKAPILRYKTRIRARKRLEDAKVLPLNGYFDSKPVEAEI